MADPATTYQSPAEAAAEIRATLKRAGITSRQVSIRSRSFSMGSAIEIAIHDPAVAITQVRAAAADKERIHRDEATGEILCGCNRHLSIAYSDGAAALFAAANAAAIAALLAEIPAPHTSVGGPAVEIDGRRLCIFRDAHNGIALHLRELEACAAPAWLPQPEHLSSELGARYVATVILGLRGRA